MNRRAWTIVAAVALAAVGTFAIVAYVNGAESRALAGEKVVKVLVASEPIATGTAGDDLAGSVTTERVPEKVRAEGAVSQLRDLRGFVAAEDIVAGEQLTVSRFVSPDKVDKGIGVVQVPKGMLEVTLSLDAARAMGGRVTPGSHVAVLASFDQLGNTSDQKTGIILHKALVTNVQVDQDSSKPDSADVAPSAKTFVTLAGTADQVTSVTFAAEHGTVWLAAEPSDAADGPGSVIDSTQIYGH